MPSTTSLMSEIVLSKDRLLVDGLVFVVPKLCFLPCPLRQFGSPGDPGVPRTGEPKGGLDAPPATLCTGESCAPPREKLVENGSWLKCGGEEGEFGVDDEGDAGCSSSTC